MLNKKIGINLKRYRRLRQLTQLELARQAKISVNYYAQIERDEMNPTIETLEKIVKALKIKSSDILPF